MKRLLTMAAMFLCCMATSFAQFSGSGSGTESDPYLILNPIQLNQMRNFLNKSGVYFKLMADIDLTEFLEDENPSQGWLPVGNSSSAFKGVLDGNGKCISGLWIKRPSSNVGLFGYTETGATIKNLTIEATNIKGNNNVGGLCGSGNGTISNCVVKGVIKGLSSVGGFIGNGSYSITGCESYVDVFGEGNDVGGFVGNSYQCSFSKNRVSSESIEGLDNVGGVCGYHNSYGTMANNSVKANIRGNNYVGGIVGQAPHEKSYPYSSINIIDCGFVGIISGNNNVGGVCGYYEAYHLKVSHCYAFGDIFALSNNIGGIIGCCNNTNYIGDCFFSGSIMGGNNVGGLIGYKDKGYVMSSYTASSVVGIMNVGGLIGYNGSAITKSVAANSRISASQGVIGRIVGYNSGDLGIPGSSDENKSYNRTIVISQGVAQDVNEDAQNGTNVSATTLKLKATFVAMGWDFTDTWEIQETECYPYFKTQTAPPVITSEVVSGATTISGKCVNGATVTLEINGVKQEKVCTGTSFSFSVDPLQAGNEVRVCAKADGKEQSYFDTKVVSYLGSGKENDPYQISTAADLSQAYRYGYYKLMNDIDLTSYISKFSPTEGWESIGREGSETIYFDGDGHKITGLWCNSTRDNTGLFSCFANGYIKNLTIETAEGKQVKGGANTGILIGKMINGIIENCKVSGNVADGTPVGGIVGLLDGGKIRLSQATVTVNTTGNNTYVGGLVGDITSGEIDQCVTLGALTATGKNSQAGGLVGKNAATITNCYSNVAVTSAYCAAGLVAYNYGLVEKCYATGDLSSMNYGAGVIGYNDGENAVIRNCVAMNQKIDVTYESQSAQSGGYGQRILGGYKNGAPDPELNNYALKTMQLSVNDIPQKVYNDIMNGVAKKGEELMKASTYQELNWDFTDSWSITEDDSYPFLKNNKAEVIKPVEIVLEVTAPSAVTGLVYNGKEQELITAGTTTIGDMKYSLDGSKYGKAIPTGIEAKEYTVYYKVVDDVDITEPALVKVTISPKTVGSPTITLSETSYTYDGTAKEPTVTIKDGETTIPATEYSVSYNNNTNVGTATVTITDNEGGNYIISGSTTFEIKAKDIPIPDNESIKITSAKQVPYCSGYNLDFTDKTDLKAYVATGYDKATGTIWLTRVKQVPANTGFLLMGDAGDYDIPVAESASDCYYKNMFKGTISGETIYTTDGDYTNYYLSNGDYGVGFYKVGSSVDLKANRAYLSIPTDIPAAGSEGDTETIKVGGALQVPYFTSKNLDFSTMDAQGVKAYTATGYNYKTGTIWLTRVKQVPAQTGVLVMAGEAGEYSVPTASVASVYANMFVGSESAQTIYETETIDGVDYVNYYLSNGDYGVGFYKAKSEGVDLGVNRCYLQVPYRATSGARGESRDAAPVWCNMVLSDEGDDVIAISVYGGTSGDDDTTGINSKFQNAEEDIYYNLQGQRVENPGKGVYIKNAKKVVIK